MKKHKFKVGQKVKVIKKNIGAPGVEVGDVGLVKFIDEAAKGYVYAVEFEKKRPQYHDCYLYAKPRTKGGHGYWCCKEMLEPIANETIVIYRKDDQVIALDKRTGEKAVAKCCPEDLFDFDYGAKLAFLRLTGKTEPEIKEDSIKVGDVVKIINKMLIYSTYDYWSGLGIWKKNFISGGHPDCSKEYNVLTLEKHDQVFDDLALIQHPDSKQVFIIGIKGLEKA